MKIHLTPMRTDTPLTLHRKGDILTLNGESFDFTELSEGAQLPASAIASDLFVGSVTRKDGELELTLVLPHGAAAPPATLFPVALNIEGNGPVELPAYKI